MKRVSVLLLIAATVLSAVGVSGSATAAESFTVVFTAGAEVGTDVFVPGLGKDASTWYKFNTELDGIAGQRFCVAVAESSGADPRCVLKSEGAFGPMLGVAGAGATCLYSSGRGDVGTVTVNNVNVVAGANLKVEWPAAAGTILPFTLSLNRFATNGGQVVGHGAVQVTGAKPGTCGVPSGTRFFEVTGYGTATL